MEVLLNMSIHTAGHVYRYRVFERAGQYRYTHFWLRLYASSKIIS